MVVQQQREPEMAFDFLRQCREQQRLAPALASVFTNGNKIGLQLNGVPGARYLVQATTNLTSPNWQPVFTNTADMFGNCTFTDTNSILRPGPFLPDGAVINQVGRRQLLRMLPPCRD